MLAEAANNSCLLAADESEIQASQSKLGKLVTSSPQALAQRNRREIKGGFLQIRMGYQRRSNAN